MAIVTSRKIRRPGSDEDPSYLRDQLLTYIGNKRSLLPYFDKAIEKVKKRLHKSRLRILDAFSGSSIVARYFKQHAEYLAANDLEPYAAIMARCYLRNRSEVNFDRLERIVTELNAEVDTAPLARGFIEELYAPKDESNIQNGERVFYTRRNARRLDNYRRLLNELSFDDRYMLLGPLLSKASVHANTSGVFKGFYKDRHSKLGRFGGTGGDALQRIMGEIRLVPPVLSRSECDVEVFQEDVNQLVGRLGGFDLAYFDPPYNQHPYGSNYFMLNLLVDYQRPEKLSEVSGIPSGWQRSGYNVRSQSYPLMRDLIRHTDARFILVSFNDEGFIRPEAMRQLLSDTGSVETIQMPYNTFRGSRNLRGRKIHVMEHLFLVERHASAHGKTATRFREPRRNTMIV